MGQHKSPGGDSGDGASGSGEEAEGPAMGGDGEASDGEFDGTQRGGGGDAPGRLGPTQICGGIKRIQLANFMNHRCA